MDSLLGFFVRKKRYNLKKNSDGTCTLTLSEGYGVDALGPPTKPRCDIQESSVHQFCLRKKEDPFGPVYEIGSRYERIVYQDSLFGGDSSPLGKKVLSADSQSDMAEQLRELVIDHCKKRNKWW